MPRLTLYSTTGCHLCEEAEGLLHALRAQGGDLDWSVVDIADDDALFERYGWSIPVVRREDGAELAWPFDLDGARAFAAGGADAANET
jgi:hypothetical protein